MAYGTNAPFGLRPISSITGGSWTEKTNEYRIGTDANGANSYGTSIYTGDPVIWNPVLANGGGGTIAQSGAIVSDGNNANNLVPILGVFQGCEYTLSDGTVVKSPYWPAGTAVQAGSAIKAYVIDDPNVVYDIQVSTLQNTAAQAAFAPTRIGQNFAFGIAGGGANLIPNNPVAGSDRTGQSAFYLNTTFNANASYINAAYPLKTVGYTLNPNNNVYAADGVTVNFFLNVRVIINNHVYRAGTVGITAA